MGYRIIMIVVVSILGTGILLAEDAHIIFDIDEAVSQSDKELEETYKVLNNMKNSGMLKMSFYGSAKSESFLKNKMPKLLDLSSGLYKDIPSLDKEVCPNKGKTVLFSSSTNFMTRFGFGAGGRNGGPNSSCSSQVNTGVSLFGSGLYHSFLGGGDKYFASLLLRSALSKFKQNVSSNLRAMLNEAHRDIMSKVDRLEFSGQHIDAENIANELINEDIPYDATFKYDVVDGKAVCVAKTGNRDIKLSVFVCNIFSDAEIKYGWKNHHCFMVEAGLVKNVIGQVEEEFCHNRQYRSFLTGKTLAENFCDKLGTCNSMFLAENKKQIKHILDIVLQLEVKTNLVNIENEIKDTDKFDYFRLDKLVGRLKESLDLCFQTAFEYLIKGKEGAPENKIQREYQDSKKELNDFANKVMGEFEDILTKKAANINISKDFDTCLEFSQVVEHGSLFYEEFSNCKRKAQSSFLSRLLDNLNYGDQVVKGFRNTDLCDYRAGVINKLAAIPIVDREKIEGYDGNESCLNTLRAIREIKKIEEGMVQIQVPPDDIQLRKDLMHYYVKCKGSKDHVYSEKCFDQLKITASFEIERGKLFSNKGLDHLTKSNMHLKRMFYNQNIKDDLEKCIKIVKMNGDKNINNRMSKCFEDAQKKIDELIPVAATFLPPNSKHENAVNALAKDWEYATKTLTRDIDVYHWFHNREGKKNAGFEYSNVIYANFMEYLAKLKLNGKGNMLGLGLYAATDPSATDSYGDHLLKITIPKKSNFLDLRALDSSGECDHGSVKVSPNSEEMLQKAGCDLYSKPGINKSRKDSKRRKEDKFDDTQNQAENPFSSVPDPQRFPGFICVYKSSFNNSTECNQVFNDALKKMNINMIAYPYGSALPNFCDREIGLRGTAFVLTNTPLNSSTIKHFDTTKLKKMDQSSDEFKKYQEEVGQFHGALGYYNMEENKLNNNKKLDMCKKYASRFFGCKCNGLSYTEDGI